MNMTQFGIVQKRKKQLVCFAVACAVSLLFNMDSSGQIYPALNQLKGLTEADRDLMRKTAREEISGQEEGTRLPWKNETSGNRGSVQLVEKLEIDSNECRKIIHRLVMKSGTRPRFEFTICNIDGEWKIVP